MTVVEEYNFLKAYLSEHVYKEMYEKEDPIKLIKIMKHNWKNYLHIFSYIVAVVGFVLGYIGFFKYYTSVPAKQYPSNIVFEVIRLFALQNEFSLPVAIPPELEFARFLCPIALIYNVVRVFGPLLQENLKLVRLQFYRNHTIVCGLNKWTAQLLIDLKREEKQIVVIEKDVNNEHNSKAKELGIILLHGDFSDYYLLNKAKIEKAKYLIIFTEDDSKNMEIAINTRRMIEKEKRKEQGKLNKDRKTEITTTSKTHIVEKKHHKKKLRCFIHINDKCLCDSFSTHDIFEQSYEKIEMNVFNIYDNDARVLFLSQAFESKLKEGEKVHLLIIGFSDLGESVALQAVKIGHYANDKGTKLTILDEKADKVGKRFLARYPGINQLKNYLHFKDNTEDYFEFTFRNVDLKNLEEIEKTIAKIDSNQKITAILICLEDKASGIKIGIHLMSKLKNEDVEIKLHFPIQVYLDENEDIFNLPSLESTEEKYPKLSPFGLIKSTCSKEIILNEKLDRVAKKILKSYNKYTGSSDEWDKLRPDFKDSNRNQADHLPIKLRAINIKISKTGKKRTDFRAFTKDEVDLLARMEHNRWCAERWLSGWEHTPGEKDVENKKNPLLKHFDKFTPKEQEIKELDRVFVRDMDKFVKELGLELEG
jgi:hypothetical protein